MDSRDHARRLRRIVVPGPLAPFADGVRQDLAGQGYALATLRATPSAQVQLGRTANPEVSATRSSRTRDREPAHESANAEVTAEN